MVLGANAATSRIRSASDLTHSSSSATCCSSASVERWIPPSELSSPNTRIKHSDMSHRFAGIYTPIVTPFTPRRRARRARACVANVDRYLASPLTGLVVLGSNGEAAQLEDDEADRVDRHRARARAEGSAAAGRHRPRVHARDDCRVQAGRGARRRRGDGANAVVLQAADDDARPSSGTTPRSPTLRRCRCCSTT